MNIREEILDYIGSNETTGAILLTGQWGCGKSYLVKEIAKELNDNKEAAVAVISLFGLDSIAAINKRVKDEYSGFLLGGFLGKTAKKLSKAFTTVAKDGMSVASIAAGGVPGITAASQGLSTIIDYNILGFVEVKNTIGKDDKKRKFVLVFDDLERSNLEKKNLLGALNEYVENKNIKVIIVADEEKISGEEYKEYKEKLISRTIRLKANYDMIIDSIISNYHERSNGYTSFLSQHANLLKQVFAESKSDNIRTIKCVITDFERFYDVLSSADVSDENMKWALYTFSVEVFVSKDPKRYEDNREIRERGPFSLSPKEKHFTDLKKNENHFSSFSDWINKGEWDKDVFLNELKNRYCETSYTPFERFVRFGFWDLQQSDIEQGLPQALEYAYEGKLSTDGLISLLIKIHILNANAMKLPCKVDYKKLEAGYDRRIEGIKDGSIIMQKHSSFAFQKDIDSEAISLNNKIDNLHNTLYAWNLRKKLLQFFNGNTSISRFDIKGGCIAKFDDDLFDTFITQYSSAKNTDKREFAVLLLDMHFDNSTYSTAEDIQCSKKNFERLISWLTNQEIDDTITKLINKKFVEHIQNMEIMKSNNE